MKTPFPNAYESLRRLLARDRDPLDSQPQEAPAGSVKYQLERFSIFQGRLCLSGWAVSETDEIMKIALVTSTNERFPIKSYGLASDDVAKTFGDRGRYARFHEMVDFTCEAQLMIDAALVFELKHNSVVSVKKFYEPSLHADPALRLFVEFLRQLNPEIKGHLLEIGARARSGVTRRQFTPQDWTYTGFDIVAGENVDVIGDAHQLSSYLPEERYDAVMGFSVLEHLMMPWKFVLELNRVMKVDGIGLFLTHQCWPLHDDPWDFWRFSADAWAALLNPHTGFEIIEAKAGQPAFVIANIGNPASNFPQGSMGYLASCVMFRKTGRTTLSWPVNVDDIVATHYPTSQ